jgi:hypothetical protein
LLRRSGVQPGIFAQGPDEKSALAGRTAGFVFVINVSILADGPALGGEG